jgi:hypothetical protein
MGVRRIIIIALLALGAALLLLWKDHRRRVDHRLSPAVRGYRPKQGLVKQQQGNGGEATHSSAAVAVDGRKRIPKADGTVPHQPATDKPVQATINFVYLGLWPHRDAPMPSAFQDNLRSWRRQNGDFAVKLWSFDDVLQLLGTKGLFSDDIGRAFRVASPIQKADMARYCILAMHGGWYFDLDTGVQCATGGSLQRCTNDLHALSAELSLAGRSGALFWERGPLNQREQARSALRSCRGNVPEYPLRLANYALYAHDQRGREFFQSVLRLAACRVLRERERPRGCDPEYTVLFTTGPDVTSEVAQGQRSIHGCGRAAAAADDDGDSAGAAHSYNMLVVDPRSLVMNANSFTWRGASNSALAHDTPNQY